jgi:hypothetical protein
VAQAFERQGRLHLGKIEVGKLGEEPEVGGDGGADDLGKRPNRCFELGDDRRESLGEGLK